MYRFHAGVTVRAWAQIGGPLRRILAKSLPSFVHTNRTVLRASVDVVFPWGFPKTAPAMTTIRVGLADVYLTPSLRVVQVSVGVRDLFSEVTVSALLLYGVQHTPPSVRLANAAEISDLLTATGAKADALRTSMESALLLRVEFKGEDDKTINTANGTLWSRLTMTGKTVGLWRPNRCELHLGMYLRIRSVATCVHLTHSQLRPDTTQCSEMFTLDI